MTLDERRSAKRTARVAGGLYLALIPLGMFSFVYVPSAVLAGGDAATTSRNILESELLFRLGIASHLTSQVVVVFLLLALYRLFRPVNGDLAAAMAVLGLLCVPISFIAELNSLGALHLLTMKDVGAFNVAQLRIQAMQLLDMQRSGVLLAQVFWALWLFPLAALIFRSGFLPKALSIPVLIAAAGYLFDSTSYLLSPGLGAISPFTAVAELVLPLWLVVKGVRVEPPH